MPVARSCCAAGALSIHAVIYHRGDATAIMVACQGRLPWNRGVGEGPELQHHRHLGRLGGHGT